jgi:curved DNA-binding protein CbpA
MLKLTPHCSLEKLNESFRKLAKIYHPDSNKDREQWAHRTMTELNLAYETVIDFLTTPPMGMDEDRQAPEKNPSAKTHPRTSKRTRYQILFTRSMKPVLDGMYTYYQYGLENERLRYEGVRRLRFRDSVRDLQKGIENLENLKGYPKSEGAAGRLQLFIDFSKAFRQSMLIDNYTPPMGEPAERIAYRHFRNGSSHLDYAIKDALFGDQLIQVRSGSYAEKLRLSREELMLVVSRFYNSGCFSEAMLKIYLLEVFSKVVRVMERMRY